MLAYGHRAHLGRLMPVERFRADQLVIAIFLPASSLGLYAVAIAFTNVLRFLTQSIGYVAFPAVARERDAAAAKRAMWRYVRMAIALSVGVVLTLEIIGPMLISYLFGEDFSDAGRILQILLPGVGFVGVRRVLAESLRGGGYATATSVAEAVTGIAFLVAVLPLMRLWDLNGVALTVTAAEGLGLAVLVWFMVRDDSQTPSPGSGVT
jgi:O-antigen/teichoic acid export membrane protein